MSKCHNLKELVLVIIRKTNKFRVLRTVTYKINFIVILNLLYEFRNSYKTYFYFDWYMTENKTKPYLFYYSPL